MEVVASLSQGRTAAAQCDLFTHKSVPVIFEPPCISMYFNIEIGILDKYRFECEVHRLVFIIQCDIKIQFRTLYPSAFRHY